MRAPPSCVNSDPVDGGPGPGPPRDLTLCEHTSPIGATERRMCAWQAGQDLDEGEGGSIVSTALDKCSEGCEGPSDHARWQRHPRPEASPMA